MTAPPPIPLAGAQQRLFAMAKPLGSEALPVEQALGRFLAAPVTARRSQPAANLSAMDGYAMRADDPAGPWRVVGESAAGDPFAGALAPGEAIRVFTGAIMPGNGGAVLLLEDAARDGDRLHTTTDAPEPRHIRRAGFDFAHGNKLLDRGVAITSARIALVLASGNAQVEVGRRPSLAVLDSGNELSADPEHCEPHQIPASNGAMIAAMAAPLVSSVTRIGPVRDRMSALRSALEQAEGYDVLVTSGGASVGDHDLVRPALEEWGATIDFWRVAIKPGKPLLVARRVARRGRQIVLGLPGNPVSSYVTAYLFLLPLLRKLAGAGHPLPRTVKLNLTEALPATGSRTEFLRAVHTGGLIGPVPQQDSSALRSLASANALIRRELNAPPAAPGDSVPAYVLDNGGIA